MEIQVDESLKVYHDTQKYIGELEIKIAALEAENARLREALESIVQIENDGDNDQFAIDAYAIAHRAICRVALLTVLEDA